MILIRESEFDMEKRKLTKEDLDKVRHIEGFPIGKDEDIIALSDPPYYTACPNPFIADFIKEHGTPYDEATDDYHREPFASDVSEGKNDPIYNAHTYHTKTPHKAIMQYIHHYTNPGDLIFDGFCGTGMTGVATVASDSETNDKRYTIICDLSPAATYIASRYTLPHNVYAFRTNTENIVRKLRNTCQWMFKTYHTALGEKGHSEFGDIEYTVWSDVFICPHCSNEIIYWNVAVDFETHETKSQFACNHCGANVKKSECKRAQIFFFDGRLKQEMKVAKQVPVRIVYRYGNKRYIKPPDAYDMNILKKIENEQIINWFPVDELPDGYNTQQPIRSHGVTNVHYFYTKRVQYELAFIYNEIQAIQDKDEKNTLLTLITGILNRNAYKCNRFVINKYNPNGRINGPKSGTLYIPSLVVEQNISDLLDYKIPQLIDMFVASKKQILITTQSSTDLRQIPDNVIEYIFTDPPFGENLNYSELSFIWETWLKVKTNNKPEAIMNSVQNKSLKDYHDLMTQCFSEFYRILKPKRWITVEFHNSKNTVWNSIQEAMRVAGFIVADVRILDKKRANLHQLVSTSAVKQDLIISAYKPSTTFTTIFTQNAGTEETAWAFVRQHLANLPVVVKSSGKIETVTERQAFLLFDRMVAYHIMQGLPVPIDAADFYKGLDDRFLKRDSMYFLPDQVTEYDLARSSMELEKADIALFVTDEKSAIGWLYVQLDEKNGGKRQTYQVLQPKFMQEVRAVKRTEKMPELITMLEENFLEDDSGAWYVPDLAKSGDVAKLREKNLLKEFQEYQATKGKLKVFRSEAIRVGFAKLWKDKEYKAIVALAERLPEETVQEDPNILMYYDISLSRV